MSGRHAARHTASDGQHRRAESVQSSDAMRVGGQARWQETNPSIANDPESGRGRRVVTASDDLRSETDHRTPPTGRIERG